MVDYSKWKNIEVSDDEDDTHPNIDTPSLFRWRHQARVERMEERQKELEQHEKKKQQNQATLAEKKTKLEEAIKSSLPNLEELKRSIQELEKEAVALREEEIELRKKEKLAPWNVDTISQPGFEKTVINKRPAKQADENLTEEQREARMKKFIKSHEKELKHFGMLKRYDDSRKYLKERDYLVCEDTANYLVVWCINLEMEEKHELMCHIAHQTICMQYILELAKQLNCDPRACVDAFFSKIQVAEPEYRHSFEDELEQFKERIQKRAGEKIEEALKEAEEEEKQKRLGPGGLDPVEVFETLPTALQECFKTQDVQMLQDTITKMDEQEAKYHMKRCIDSGLWVPDGKKMGESEGTEQESPDSQAEVVVKEEKAE